MIKTVSREIKEYGDLQVPAQHTKVKRDQHQAFLVQQNEFIKKLSIIGQKIQDKQKVYADLAIKTAKDSMVSVNDPNMNSYMVDGITNEENKN